MKTHRYNKVLYYIGTVIFITLVIQIYWNYQNYLSSQKEFHNAIQTSIDAAVENYYASNARGSAQKRFTAFREAASPAPVSGKSTLRSGQMVPDNQSELRPVQIVDFENLDRKVQVVQLDPSKVDIQNFVGKVIYSIKQDSIDLQKIDSLTRIELSRKQMEIDFGLALDKNGTVKELRPHLIQETSSRTVAKSPWLPKNSSLTLYFSDGVFPILKYNLLGISLSAILLASVVGCLFFLLSVIRNQKHLAEMKNDFVNNITHEFKTPIATIKVALEGIFIFNEQNDQEKTAKYLETSNEQLGKLDDMVEKLLETATLDSRQMVLKKEKGDLINLLNRLVEKHKSCAPEKSLKFNGPEEVQIKADLFHLENALNNIFDNAVKYGGNLIEVFVLEEGDKVKIIIRDNGSSLTSLQIRHLFDKFYRVPKGNVHDIKGFGIGLYYTKKVIDQHAGEINVEVDVFTDFIIRLPYE